MKMKTYHAPRSGIAAYAEGKDYIVIQFKTGQRYRYDFAQPGRRHVAKMKALAHRTSGLTTYINQHVRENYSRKLTAPPNALHSPRKPVAAGEADRPVPPAAVVLASSPSRTV